MGRGFRRAAPDAALWSVRVLGSRLTGKGVVFAAGLRWAITQGARVVNLSLSTSREDYFGLFHQIADEAAFADVILVCAANNVPAPTYPAQFSSVISVAAHDRRDPFGLDANPAPPAEFGTPGIDIRVPWLSGSTIVATGNSFAAGPRDRIGNPPAEQAPAAHAVRSQDRAAGRGQQRGGPREQAMTAHGTDMSGS